MPRSDPPAPFLKWAGGKTQLLSRLVSCMPREFGTYYEPFLGAGALFFRLSSMGKISRAVIADVNKDLINCYLAVRDELDYLVSLLDEYQKHVDEMDFFYEVARPAFNKIRLTGGGANAEKAALLIYLNKTCFNGLYRVNSKEGFNAPWGRYRSPGLYSLENLKAVSGVLNGRGIQIRCCDYRETVKDAQRGDLVYFDPPYQPLNPTSSFTQYTGGAFTAEDQRDLADTFMALDGRGCNVMLSNSCSPLVEELYAPYIKKGCLAVVMASRAISCVGSGRGKIPEYIVYNYNPG